MKNLIKYELKGRVRFITGCIITLIISNFFITLRIFDIKNNNATPETIDLSIGLLLTPLLIIFIIMIVSAFKTIDRDINEGTGYLIFSLPTKGYKIIGSKIIVLCAEFSIYVIISFIYAVITTFKVKGYEFSKSIIMPLFREGSLTIMSFITVYTLLALLIFLSLIFGKSVTSQRKNSKTLSFAAFSVLALISGFLAGNIQGLTYGSIDIHIFAIGHRIEFLPIGTDVGVICLYIILSIIFFLVTSKLVDNRMEI